MTAQQQARFNVQVVIITGADVGLERAYVLLFAQRGTSVVVNDTVWDVHVSYPGSVRGSG